MYIIINEDFASPPSSLTISASARQRNGFFGCLLTLRNFSATIINQKKIIAFLCLVTIVFSVCSCDYNFYESIVTRNDKESKAVRKTKGVEDMENIEENKPMDIIETNDTTGNTEQDESTGNIEENKYTSNIENQYMPYIFLNALAVYKSVDTILVIASDNGGTIQRRVEFSFDRKNCHVQGLDLIENEDVGQFLNIGFNEVMETLGQPHADIGSGFYIPAYITKDAYLICFDLENDIVVGIIKRDLLTNEIVDCVRSY